VSVDPAIMLSTQGSATTTCQCVAAVRIAAVIVRFSGIATEQLRCNPLGPDADCMPTTVSMEAVDSVAAGNAGRPWQHPPSDGVVMAVVIFFLCRPNFI